MPAPSRPRRPLVLAAAIAAVTSLALPIGAAVAAVDDPPGTVVLPGHLSAYSAPVVEVTGSGGATAYSTTDETGAPVLRFRPAADAAWSSQAVNGYPGGLALVGTSLAYAAITNP